MNKIPETRIDKKAIRAWEISGLVFGLTWLAVPAAVYYYSYKVEPIPQYTLWSLLATMLVVYLVNALVVPKIRWQRWRYDITENEIDLQRGFFIRKRTVIPINRIQHVDTSQGPIYRKLGLSSVKVSTAATTHEIPALDDETAADVRNKISLLVRKAKEDV